MQGDVHDVWPVIQDALDAVACKYTGRMMVRMLNAAVNSWLFSCSLASLSTCRHAVLNSHALRERWQILKSWAASHQQPPAHIDCKGVIYERSQLLVVMPLSIHYPTGQLQCAGVLLARLTMVHIPVQDQHALNALLLACCQCGHRHVVVKAEAHGTRAFCMVPWWPHHCEGPLHIATAHCLHCLHQD